MSGAEQDIWHGGDLERIGALFPDALRPWVDLSTGINPISYPLPTLPLRLWQRLPASQDEATLLAAAGAAYRVPSQAGIVAAPGTQILIDLLPRLVPARTVAVLGPTYAEHALAWRKSGAVLREVATLEEGADADVVVLVNPNNPDGRIVERDALLALSRRMAARNGLLVVDEAFCDFTPDASIVPLLPPAALVLRSFGKTYGLAGLRLGFAIGDRVLTTALARAMGPWAVAGPALHVGACALSDAPWLAQAARARTADATRLDALLAVHGRIVGGTALFRLLETPAAASLFAHLGRCGIYVRRFQHDGSLLRFGVPADASAWRRLDVALGAFARDAGRPSR